MKSLSELEASADVGRPEREFPICVSGKLTRELEAADAELFEVKAELDAAEQEARDHAEGGGRPRRTGERSKVAELEKRAQAAAEKCDAIRARMEDHTVTLDLKGKTNGEWRAWVSVNPPRDPEDDKAGAERDRRWAGNFCDVDALIANLSQYVAKYGDDEPSERWQALVFENAAPGDLTRLASAVVAMHEQVTDTGKSRAAWLSGRKKSTDSE